MNTFVIHEHEALRAGWHHDLRLERDGALKSWAENALLSGPTLSVYEGGGEVSVEGYAVGKHR